MNSPAKKLNNELPRSLFQSTKNQVAKDDCGKCHSNLFTPEPWMTLLLSSQTEQSYFWYMPPQFVSYDYMLSNKVRLDKQCLKYMKPYRIW